MIPLPLLQRRRLLCRTLAGLALVTSLGWSAPSSLHAQDKDKDNKASPSYAKVLFLGNSITKHGPKADIEWLGNWGMAASAEDKDYVHLVTSGLTKASGTGTAPEVMVKNIADFERLYATYEVETKLKDTFDFRANLVILAIGENVPALQSEEDKVRFKQQVAKLLAALKAGGTHPTIIVRSSFWQNDAKDQALQQVCTEAGGIFVNISALGKEESNYARAERPFKNAGVARHPGDKGMQAIAEAILKAVPKP